MAGARDKIFDSIKDETPRETAAAPAQERVRREIITEYDVDKISPSKDNTFSQNKDDKYEELLESIKADGIYEPLKIYSDPENSGRYIIFSGHRRFMAATELGLTKVPCVLIKGAFSPAEINAKLFAYNQGKRGDDPFGKARSVKKHDEIQKTLPKKDQVSAEKALRIPHGRVFTRLKTLAKLDNDILVLGQLGLLTAELAENFVAAAEDKEGILDSVQNQIRAIYSEEKDLDSQKAAIKKCIMASMKRPKKKGQTSPAVTANRIKREAEKLSQIDLTGESAKKKEAIRATLLAARDMLDAQLKDLE